MSSSSNSGKIKRSDAHAKRDGQQGYAYVMALFMVLTVIVGSQMILRNMVTERRSQREADMIWSGNQYARAIRMYFRKTGHYPQTQDDLLTGVPDMHFIRSEALKDPMNKEDGAWRFIYTNASGAIIGSVKYGSLQQMALMDMNGGQMPGTQPAPGANGTTFANQSSASGNITSSSGALGTGTSTSTSSSGFSLGLGGGTQNSGTPGSSTAGTGMVLGPLGQPVPATAVGPKPTGPVDGPVIGGQLIGVGSKVDQSSVRVYKGGKKYNEWEFIWNPIEEQAMAVQQGLGQGAPGAAGAPAAGGLFGLPIGSTGGTGSIAPSSGNSGTSGTNSNNSGSSGNSGSSTNTPSQ